LCVRALRWQGGSRDLPSYFLVVASREHSCVLALGLRGVVCTYILRCLGLRARTSWYYELVVKVLGGVM
jgi:hypothetical protein